MSKVLVSVIMPNYNTPLSYLKEAVESILVQTFSNFEFIIIDDASNDESISYLESLTDNRIRLIKNSKNLGITKSLNIGLKHARGQYIARMDSDDIADPKRFEIQLEYMESNPDVIVSGTWFEKFGVETQIRKPVIYNFEQYKCQLLFGNMPITLCHPSVMFRKEMLDIFQIEYDETLNKAQDYAMWVVCSKVGRIAIIEQVLLKYRTHEKQVSINNYSEQAECANKTSQRQLEQMGLKVESRLSDWRIGRVEGIRDFHCYYNWLMSINSANDKCRMFKPEELNCYVNIMLEKSIRRMKAEHVILLFFKENKQIKRIIINRVLKKIRQKCFKHKVFLGEDLYE